MKKPYELLLEEMKGENRLRRVLGPVSLTSLGVGAIIGTGICGQFIDGCAWVVGSFSGFANNDWD